MFKQISGEKRALIKYVIKILLSKKEFAEEKQELKNQLERVKEKRDTVYCK
jgi:hypothetical protein